MKHREDTGRHWRRRRRRFKQDKSEDGDDDDEGGELKRQADVIDDDNGSRTGHGRNHRDGGGLSRERRASGDLNEDDGIVFFVVKLRHVSLCASDHFLGSGSRGGSSALRAILVQVVLAALAGGVFIAARAQLGDPDRGRCALRAARLALRRPIVGGGAALLVLAVDTAKRPGGAVVGVWRGGARGRALLRIVATVATYGAIPGRKHCSGH
jgi:hypothetical protein